MQALSVGIMSFFDEDLPSDYYRDFLWEEHQKGKRGVQRNEMQEQIHVLTMEKKLLADELTCIKAKLQLYDKLFLMLIGILIVFCVVFGMKA
jgi:hypothetical protein